jgi:hypothetical protein
MWVERVELASESSVGGCIVLNTLKKPGIDIRFARPKTTCLVLCVEQGYPDCCKLILDFASKFPQEDMVSSTLLLTLK